MVQGELGIHTSSSSEVSSERARRVNGHKNQRANIIPAAAPGLAVAVYFDAPGRFALEAGRVGWTAPLVAVRDVVNRTSLGIYKRNAVIGVESSTAHSVRCFRFSRLFGSATIV